MKMRRAEAIVADEFERLLAERNDTEGWSRDERMLYRIVCVRSEMDINSFEDVFEQLLSSDELDELVAMFAELGEPTLADWFIEVRDMLAEANYVIGSGVPLPSSGAVTDRLRDIGENVRSSEMLWRLDEKLATLFRSVH